MIRAWNSRWYILVEAAGPLLLGRDWLHRLLLDWSHICNEQLTPPGLAAVLSNNLVFQKGLGGLKGLHAKIHVSPNAQQIFKKPHSVQYMLKEAVERVLERLQKERVIEPVRFC